VAHVIKGIRRAAASKSVENRRRLAATLASNAVEIGMAEQLNRIGDLLEMLVAAEQARAMKDLVDE
jgi:hypothetical protein